MNKQEMATYIKSNYKGLQQAIMMAQLDYLKNGKFYGWKDAEGNKHRLINRNGNYTIESV